MTKSIKEILLEVTQDISEFYAISKTKDYIVYYPEQEGSELAADDCKKECSLKYSVEVHLSKPSNRSLVSELEKTFKKYKVSYYLSNCEYDTETNYLKYSFEVEV